MAANSPALDDARRRLALIQSLWDDLQAARNDAAKYEALAQRLRQEADAFRHALHTSRTSSEKKEERPR